MNNGEYLELRIAYPTRARLYQISGLNKYYRLNRIEVGDLVRYHKEFPERGDAVAVYELPPWNALYQLDQVIDGKSVQRFFAVCDGVLHPIPRDSVERIAEGSLSIRGWAASLAEDGVSI
jgi:hypothetical protein